MQSDLERQDLRRNIKDAVSKKDAVATVRHARTLLESSSKPAEVMFCASSFARIADALKDQLGAKRLKTYIVRSVTVEPILPFLSVEAVLSNYVLDLQVGGYGSSVDGMLKPPSALSKFKPDLVLVVLVFEENACRLPGLFCDRMWAVGGGR